MSGDPLAQVGAELVRIANNNCTVTVIEADCTIQKVWEFDEKKFKDFQGGGGTAYAPALEYADKLGVDLIIYLGDMDQTSETIKKPKVPVIWGIVGNQKAPANFGKSIKIDIKKKTS